MTLELTTFTVEIGTKTFTLEALPGGQVAQYRDDQISLIVGLYVHSHRKEHLVKADVTLHVMGTSPGEARVALQQDSGGARGEFLSDDALRILVLAAWADALNRYTHDFKHAELRYHRFRAYDEELTKIMGPGWGLA